jgi:hypothetical protein
MIDIRKFDTLGHANHGWLDARHHFSFANYYDEAEWAGARCASGTTTPSRRSPGFRRTRIATWKSSPTSAPARSRTAIRWATPAARQRAMCR